MSVFTEGGRALDFMMSEDDFHLARDNAVILSGSGKLPAGTVLGKISVGQTGAGKFKPSPATGSDGAETAVAILAYPVDATSADVPAVIVARRAEVRAGALTYDASVNDSTKRAAKNSQLAALRIVVR